MATNCSLYRDKIPEALQAFVEKEENVVYTQTTSRDDQDVFKITVDSSNCFINVYYKNNGLTSISYQSTKRLQDLGQRCVDYIIDHTSLPDSLHKTFTLRNANAEQYEYFKEAARDTLTDVPTNDPSVSDRFW